jgi:hypothetical protein
MAKHLFRAEQDEVAPSDVASPQAVDWPQGGAELRTTARQQRRSAWQKILAAQQHSGQSISTFCRTHRLAESTFYFWRKRLAGSNDLLTDGRFAASGDVALLPGGTQQQKKILTQSHSMSQSDVPTQDASLTQKASSISNDTLAANAIHMKNAARSPGESVANEGRSSKTCSHPSSSIRRAGSMSIRHESSSAHATSSSSFVPVRVAARACGRIAIRLPNGVRIHVASPVDERALATVLSALSHGIDRSEESRC